MNICKHEVSIPEAFGDSNVTTVAEYQTGRLEGNHPSICGRYGVVAIDNVIHVLDELFGCCSVVALRTTYISCFQVETPSRVPFQCRVLLVQG